MNQTFLCTIAINIEDKQLLTVKQELHIAFKNVNSPH